MRAFTASMSSARAACTINSGARGDCGAVRLTAADPNGTSATSHRSGRSFKIPITSRSMPCNRTRSPRRLPGCFCSASARASLSETINTGAPSRISAPVKARPCASDRPCPATGHACSAVMKAARGWAGSLVAITPGPDIVSRTSPEPAMAPAREAPSPVVKEIHVARGTRWPSTSSCIREVTRMDCSPSPSMRWRANSSAPSPSASTAASDAAPMMMPRVESDVRSGFRRSVARPSRTAVASVRVIDRTTRVATTRRASPGTGLDPRARVVRGHAGSRRRRS